MRPMPSCLGCGADGKEGKGRGVRSRQSGRQHKALRVQTLPNAGLTIGTQRRAQYRFLCAPARRPPMVPGPAPPVSLAPALPDLSLLRRRTQRVPAARTCPFLLSDKAPILLPNPQPTPAPSPRSGLTLPRAPASHPFAPRPRPSPLPLTPTPRPDAPARPFPAAGPPA